MTCQPSSQSGHLPYKHMISNTGLFGGISTMVIFSIDSSYITLVTRSKFTNSFHHHQSHKKQVWSNKDASEGRDEDRIADFLQAYCRLFTRHLQVICSQGAIS